MRKLTYIIERKNRKTGEITYRAGDTNNLEIRWLEHKRGKVKSTKGYILLRLIYAYTEKDAITQYIIQKKTTKQQKELLFKFAFEENNDTKWHLFCVRCEHCRGIGFGKKGFGGSKERLEAWFPEDAKPGDFYCEYCNGHGYLYYPMIKNKDA